MPPMTRIGMRGIVAAALALSALSLLTPSTLTHDAWWWLIWGRDVLHLSLDTRAGSSWKPFPVLLSTLPELWGSGDLLRAGSAAQETSQGAAGWHAAREVLKFPYHLVVAPVLVGALAAPLLARRRGKPVVTVLFAATVAWLLVIA